jgi:hypothetical protein
LEAPNKPGCIGFLEDDSNREYYIHSVYPPTTTGDDVSLAQLLSRKETSGIPALGGRDKYEFAVILATSVLQLHGTPWLDKSEWRDELRFVGARDQKAPFAYIRKRFNHYLEPRYKGTKPSLLPFRRNETVFALGIVLIELSLGKSLRSFQTPDDLGPDGEPNFLTESSIARRLAAKEVQEKEGLRYATAVHRCIDCNFGGTDTSLENEEFRQAFYQIAVAPLHGIRDDFVK